MNTADIEAARRLIEQFEGRAAGRHNSSSARLSICPSQVFTPDDIDWARRMISLQLAREIADDTI